MTAVVNNSACLDPPSARVPGGACARQTRVGDMKVGDLVLAKNLDGEDIVTTVILNKRSEGEDVPIHEHDDRDRCGHSWSCGDG